MRGQLRQPLFDPPQVPHQMTQPGVSGLCDETGMHQRVELVTHVRAGLRGSGRGIQARAHLVRGTQNSFDLAQHREHRAG